MSQQITEYLQKAAIVEKLNLRAVNYDHRMFFKFANPGLFSV